MFIIQAPAHAPAYLTVLPDPQLTDVQQPNLAVNRKRSMTDIVYTYCKDEGTDRFTFNFTLSRAKSLELEAFIRQNMSVKWLVEFGGHIYLVHLDSNPFEQQHQKGFDAVTLIFEGTKS